MTEAQYSGSPLPLPMRVSAGMQVIELMREDADVQSAFAAI